MKATRTASFTLSLCHKGKPSPSRPVFHRTLARYRWNYLDIIPRSLFQALEVHPTFKMLYGLSVVYAAVRKHQLGPIRPFVGSERWKIHQCPLQTTLEMQLAISSPEVPVISLPHTT